ncbi:hypothetical protein IFHNHDMJ_02247 [Synechococcus sp. CBW1107]|nr:hypothetical protein IFHNHDMJ_02247 [Synechococcus sp. CBW1107]
MTRASQKAEAMKFDMIKLKRLHQNPEEADQF